MNSSWILFKTDYIVIKVFRFGIGTSSHYYCDVVSSIGTEFYLCSIKKADNFRVYIYYEPRQKNDLLLVNKTEISVLGGQEGEL